MQWRGEVIYTWACCIDWNLESLLEGKENKNFSNVQQSHWKFFHPNENVGLCKIVSIVREMNENL